MVITYIIPIIHVCNFYTFYYGNIFTKLYVVVLLLMTSTNKNKFTIPLMQWHEEINTRKMPWKGEKNPYKIWLSEIILQQTRVQQGWNYYEKFIANYPTIQQLAKAKDETVFKLWEGLGYYNRCKNLLFTARKITKEFNGQFPNTYSDLLLLKGVGPYTAAAIASFAFNLPHAVVDGNVFRVLARFFGINTPIDTAEGKNIFTQIANDVLDKKKPGLFNQAIMDFGATVCKPAIPLCNICPLQKNCIAYSQAKANYLPVKVKIIQKKNRWLHYFILQHQQKVLVHKRVDNDIWQSLFEFYLVEVDETIQWTNILVKDWLQQQFKIKDAEVTHISNLLSQQLTHQKIRGQFIKIELKTIPKSLKHYQWQPLKEIHKLAFPKFINQYLESKELQGNLF